MKLTDVQPVSGPEVNTKGADTLRAIDLPALSLSDEVLASGDDQLRSSRSEERTSVLESYKQAHSKAVEELDSATQIFAARNTAFAEAIAEIVEIKDTTERFEAIEEKVKEAKAHTKKVLKSPPLRRTLLTGDREELASLMKEMVISVAEVMQDFERLGADTGLDVRIELAEDIDFSAKGALEAIFKPYTEARKSNALRSTQPFGDMKTAIRAVLTSLRRVKKTQLLASEEFTELFDDIASLKDVVRGVVTPKDAIPLLEEGGFAELRERISANLAKLHEAVSSRDPRALKSIQDYVERSLEELDKTTDSIRKDHLSERVAIQREYLATLEGVLLSYIVASTDLHAFKNNENPTIPAPLPADAQETPSDRAYAKAVAKDEKKFLKRTNSRIKSALEKLKGYSLDEIGTGLKSLGEQGILEASAMLDFYSELTKALQPAPEVIQQEASTASEADGSEEPSVSRKAQTPKDEELELKLEFIELALPGEAPERQELRENLAQKASLERIEKNLSQIESLTFDSGQILEANPALLTLSEAAMTEYIEHYTEAVVAASQVWDEYSLFKPENNIELYSTTAGLKRIARGVDRLNRALEKADELLIQEAEASLERTPRQQFEEDLKSAELSGIMKGLEKDGYTHPEVAIAIMLKSRIPFQINVSDDRSVHFEIVAQGIQSYVNVKKGIVQSTMTKLSENGLVRPLGRGGSRIVYKHFNVPANAPKELSNAERELFHLARKQNI